MGSAVALKYIPPPTPLYRLKRNLRLPPGAESRTIGGDVQQGRILMSSCKRCGQCCPLGGPVLHRDDLSLLDRLDAPAKGTVPFGMADLVTLRTGELVRDDVIGTLTPLESECVKLAPARGRTDWECRFLVRMPDAVPGRDAGCGIYDRRPAQCRALSCSCPEQPRHARRKGSYRSPAGNGALRYFVPPTVRGARQHPGRLPSLPARASALRNPRHVRLGPDPEQ